MQNQVDHKSKKTITRASVYIVIGIVLMLAAFAILYFPAYAQKQEKVQKFYQQEVAVLSLYDRKDQEALTLCLRDLNEYLGSLKQGVPGFVEETYSFGSRASFLWNMAGDFLTNLFSSGTHRDKAGEQLRGIWNRHLFSAKDVDHSILTIIKGFTHNLAANRNEMALQVQADLQKFVDREGLHIKFSEKSLRDAIENNIQSASSKYIGTTLGADIIALCGSELAARGVILLVNKLAAEMAAQAAARAGSTLAAEAGAEAAGEAIGGLVSFGIFIVVGIIVDYGVTEYAKKSMTESLNGEIDILKNTIMDGNGSEAGLRRALTSALEAYNRDKHEALKEAVYDSIE
jgi:type II secretory pathway pseudopilin PulG